MMKRKQEQPVPLTNQPSQKKKKPTDEPAKSSLQALLDFSQLTTTTEQDVIIKHRFDEIATCLLHEFHLVVVVITNGIKEEIEFEILEMEFYLQMGGFHEDPFTHGSEEQKISGQWYFHRTPRKSTDSHRSSTGLKGYRGGSRKGLDLTIGGGPPTTLPILSKHFTPSPLGDSKNQPLLCGGILLRSLRQLGNDSKVISGPSLLVDHILNVSGAASISDLVENKWGGDTCAFNIGDPTTTITTKLFLRPISSSTPLPTIYRSPRIGLDLSHPGTTKPSESSTKPLHPRIQFLPKLYRYFTHPENLIMNGRPQTFLGILLLLLSSTRSGDFTEALERPSLSQEIAVLMAIKEPTCAKYLAEYVGGRKGGVGVLNSFVGAQGKGASSSPSSYLRMMGALSNLS